MNKVTTYKDLLIWQKGIEIVKETYLLCKESKMLNAFIKSIEK